MDILTISQFLPDGKPNPNYHTVTLRHRDTREQAKARIKITDIKINLNEWYQQQKNTFLSGRVKF